MAKPKCTGLNCPVQYEYADPKTCQEPEKCPYATFPQTNADRIRAMTDEELAKIYASASYCDICPVRTKYFSDVDACKSCYERFLGWLRSPVEDSEKEA